MRKIVVASFAAIAVFSCLLMASAPSHARLIQVDFEGVVRDSRGPSGISVGDLLTGSFYYDPSVPDSSPGPTRGGYDQLLIPGARVAFRAGPYFREIPLRALSVGVNTREFAQVFAQTEDEDGNFTQLFAIQMFRDLGAFEGDAMPLALSFADYATGQFPFQTGGRHESPADHVSFYADMTSLETVSQVPLPPAVWLFLSALMGLLSLSRKGKRSATPECAESV